MLTKVTLSKNLLYEILMGSVRPILNLPSLVTIVSVVPGDKFEDVCIVFSDGVKWDEYTQTTNLTLTEVVRSIGNEK